MKQHKNRVILRLAAMVMVLAALIVTLTLTCEAMGAVEQDLPEAGRTERRLTAAGMEQAVEGVSVAGKREWLGKAIIMYAEDPQSGGLGEFIGYFDFTDTGAGIDTDGDGAGDSLINGTSIDVYREDMEGVREWVRRYGDYVYIQIVDAKG